MPVAGQSHDPQAVGFAQIKGADGKPVYVAK
jgi:hypothetical protein